MKRLLCLLSCTLTLMWLPPSARSADNATELLIARPEGFFPPNEMVLEGHLSGVHIDMIEAVAATLNLKVSFASVPWKRAIWMLQKGEVDAITYMSKTAEREEFGLFEDGNKLSTTQNAFFTLAPLPERLKFSGDMRQLQPFTIGTIRGRAYFAEFDQASFLAKDDGAADEEQLLQKLLVKRFDVALGIPSRIDYYARQKQVEERLVYLKPYAPAVPNYLVFSKARQHEALARRFATAMLAFKNSPRFFELLARYHIKKDQF